MKYWWLIVLLVVPLLVVLLVSMSSTSGGEELNTQAHPKVWYCDRVLIVEGNSVPANVLRAFLNPDANLWLLGTPVSPVPVEYSCRRDVGRCWHDGKVCFKHAVEGNGWRVQWGIYYCDTGQEVNAVCEYPKACALYFTGIGCPHCAVTDPFLFYEYVPKNPLVVVEYEIYYDKANAAYFETLAQKYGLMLGVPQIVFSKDKVLLGEIQIPQELPSIMNGFVGCDVNWIPWPS